MFLAANFPSIQPRRQRYRNIRVMIYLISLQYMKHRMRIT